MSPAKINLYLNILGKYPDGFHRLESLVERVSLCDEITIKVTKHSCIKLFSNCPSIKPAENLCFKAAELFKKKFKIPFGFNIFLKKNIPIGSGLGGGSSNAAAILIGLNNLLELKLRLNILHKLGLKLGSDVNFFLTQHRFAFLEGRGEKVTPLNIGKKFHHFIIWPAISISTKRVYAVLRAHSAGCSRRPISNNVELTKFFNNAKILKYALKRGELSLIKKSIFNALEKGAFSAYSGLEKVRATLRQKNIFSKLTGSGSAFFTVSGLRRMNDCGLSLRKIKAMIPKNWRVFEAYTF